MMEAIKLRIIFLNKLKKKPNKKQRRYDHQVRERKKDCQETREKAEKYVPLQ